MVQEFAVVQGLQSQEGELQIGARVQRSAQPLQVEIGKRRIELLELDTAGHIVGEVAWVAIGHLGGGGANRLSGKETQRFGAQVVGEQPGRDLRVSRLAFDQGPGGHYRRQLKFGDDRICEVAHLGAQSRRVVGRFALDGQEGLGDRDGDPTRVEGNDVAVPPQDAQPGRGRSRHVDGGFRRAGVVHGGAAVGYRVLVRPSGRTAAHAGGTRTSGRSSDSWASRDIASRHGPTGSRFPGRIDAHIGRTQCCPAGPYGPAGTAVVPTHRCAAVPVLHRITCYLRPASRTEPSVPRPYM